MPVSARPARGCSAQLRMLIAWGLVSGLLFVMPSATLGALHVPRLRWSPCRGHKGFQCATAKVPLDRQRHGGPAIRLAVIRHRATDPALRVGSLFWDPGGPGVSGVELLPELWDKVFSAALRGRFDIVSWDPRGVGASTAVRC